MAHLSPKAQRIHIRHIPPAPDLEGAVVQRGRMGITPGAKLLTRENDVYYVKAPRNPAHAHAELLTSVLYRMADVGAPRFSIATIADPRLISAFYDHKRERFLPPGRVVALHSPWIRRLDRTAKGAGREWLLSHHPDVFDAVALDAMLGTTDLHSRNFVIHPMGHTYRIDLGGNLFFSPTGRLMGLSNPRDIYDINDPRFRTRAAPLNLAGDEDFLRSTDMTLGHLSADDIRAALEATRWEWERVAPDIPLPSGAAGGWSDTLEARRQALLNLAQDIRGGRAAGWAMPTPHAASFLSARALPNPRIAEPAPSPIFPTPDQADSRGQLPMI